jgi:putative endonuclease
MNGERNVVRDNEGSMAFYVYILASKQNGTLYLGMTDNIQQRVWQHQTSDVLSFTRKYGIRTLVWYEVHDSRESALMRERQMKKWNRAWKLRLIEELNPDWCDLSHDLHLA